MKKLPNPPICKVCDTGELHPTEVTVLSPEAVILGYCYYLVGLMLLLLALAVVFGMADPPGDGKAGGPLAALLTSGMLIPTIVSALALLAIGSVLKLKKKNLRCDHCGALIRAE